MERIKRHKKDIYKIILTCMAIIDIVWSIENDQDFFYWGGVYNPNSVVFYWVMKVIYFGFIALCGYVIYRWLMNPFYYFCIFKDWFRYAWPIGVAYLCVMFLLWPGNWGAVGDEFQTFLSVKNLRIWPDQGALSSIFMILCLMVYPRPSVISLMQCIISIIIIGSLIKKFTLLHRNKFKQIAITMLFLSLPALCYVTCPIRAWMFSILVVSLINNLYIWCKTNNEKLLRRIIVESALIANIRSEGLAFTLGVFGIILIVLETKKKRKVITRFFLIVFIFTIGIKGLAYLGNGRTLNQHSGLTYITTLSMVLTDEGKIRKIDIKDLQNIDAVYELEAILENPSMVFPFDGKRGERSFKEPTKEEMSAYTKSAIKIILENIPTFIRCKWEAVKWSLGIYPYYRTVGTCWTQDVIQTWSSKTDLPGDMTEDFIIYADRKLRERLSYLLLEPFYFKGISGFYLFYAFWIPILFLPIVLVINICRNKKMQVYMVLIEILTFILVCLMAPARYQMYYLLFYFLGWFEMISSFGNS